MKDPAFGEIEQSLQRFPTSILEEYQRASRLMKAQLGAAELLAWAEQGLTIARQTPRSWEAASEYFRVSPEILKALPFPQFLQWVQSGTVLCQDSPTICVAYFRATPSTVNHLRPRQIPGWANLGRSLYKGTWKSSALASKFYEVSPQLLEHLSYRELEMFVALVEALSSRSYDLAAESLQLGQQVFPKMGSDREAFISLAIALAEHSWREVKGCLEAAGKVIDHVEESQRVRFILLAERLARHGMANVSTFLIEGAQALGILARERQHRVLDRAEELVRYSVDAVPALVRSAPTVLERVTDAQLERWFHQGVEILQENHDGGLAYFKLESSRSEQILETLSSTVELERIKGIMRMYCQALAGASVDIEETKALADKGIGWVSEENPSTEGSKVFLPAAVGDYPDKGSNFAWFKVVATHQVAHLEFGSFLFAFERPSNLFDDLRPQLAEGHLVGTVGEGRGRHHRSEQESQPPDSSAERGWLTDMERFFDLFENRKLALDTFTAVEDGRLDYLVMERYRGIVPPYQRVQGDALTERPLLEQMPLQPAMVEFLVRLSLHQFKDLPVPLPFAHEARVIAGIARRVLDSRATVEDAVEATIRIYSIISLLPNTHVPQEQWETQNMEGADFTDQELQELLKQLQQQYASPQEDEEGEKPYESPPQVDYRGEFKPELVQLLSMLKQQEGENTEEMQTVSLTREQLEELLKKSAELELEADQSQADQTMGLFVDNLMKEGGIHPPPDAPGQGHGRIPHHDDEGGPLESKEPRTFVYDEWDFRADDYKPRWCIVREKSVAEGENQYFFDTLRNYASMIAQIRRQFEMVMPETFRKIRPLESGEDIDLDALVEAIVDKYTGNSPSDKVYWQRNKVKRDVAVVFLLDMSASTAEAIDESKRLTSDWDAPDDPVEYMIWLRSRRGEGMRRSYKRIIDLEKESMVLLTSALEAIGDVYGIYGFSGYGRENVEFYVIKDIDEQFSDKVRRRIDKIAPLHATRMGPAIRHATTKLERQEAKTKILFLISDGRPQDRGYSREGVEKEYAVHDTKMALTEARRKAITPFALTVDKAGHDYLKTMCSDMGYEVLADITMLPHRLPYLYRRLTI